MEDFRRRIDRLFEEFERGGGYGVSAGVSQFPRTNLYDTDSAYVLFAEVPGLGEKDIQVNVQQDVLTLSGERKSDIPEGYSVHRQERVPLSFSRSFTLPGRIDADNVKATVRDGILTVTLPKSPESRPRQITIEAAS
jgi:HSP20 family protein